MPSLVRRKIAVALVISTLVLSIPGVARAGLATAPLSLSGTAGDKQVALIWSAPSSNGGENISDYTIEYSTNLGTSWSTVIRSASTNVSWTVTGLTNNTTYSLRVSAVNGSGTGPASNVITATPFVVHTPNDAATYSACPTGLISTAGFTDTSSTDVDCIFYYGVTKGTTTTTYSPNDSVSRWQMALFLTRLASKSGSSLPDGSDQGFSDIGGYSAEIRTAINQIKQLGITVGKTATTYAPADNVSREEMALFIARLLKEAKAGPGGNTEFISGSTGLKEIKSNDTDHNFTDLGQSYLWETQASVKSLWNLGVTDVQNATTFSPRSDMTREAMATFMAKALGHTNARPAGLVLQASTYRSSGTPLVHFSVTHRTADFIPISGSSVDTFKFIPSVTATVTTAFDTNGVCSSTVVTSVGNTRCTVDAADPKTDADGNLASFTEVMTVLNNTDVWAWTSTPTTVYDNDLHGSTASKITVQTTG